MIHHRFEKSVATLMLLAFLPGCSHAPLGGSRELASAATATAPSNDDSAALAERRLRMFGETAPVTPPPLPTADGSAPLPPPALPAAEAAAPTAAAVEKARRAELTAQVRADIDYQWSQIAKDTQEQSDNSFRLHTDLPPNAKAEFEKNELKAAEQRLGFKIEPRPSRDTTHAAEHAAEMRSYKRTALLKGTANYPLEMLHFYGAVGTMTAAECFIKQDPTLCTQYASGLWGRESIPGHATFMLFIGGASMANVGISSMASMFGISNQRLLGGIGGHTGMVAGLAAQTIADKIWYDPARPSLIKAIGEHNLAEIGKQTKKIAGNTVLNGEFWYDQIPEAANLVGSAIVSQHVNNWAWKAVRHFAPSETAVGTEEVSRLGKFLDKYERSGSLWSTFKSPAAEAGALEGSVAKVTALEKLNLFSFKAAMGVITTVAFLQIANVGSPLIRHVWDYSTLSWFKGEKLKKLQKLQDEFEAALKTSVASGNASPAPRAKAPTPAAIPKTPIAVVAGGTPSPLTDAQAELSLKAAQAKDDDSAALASARLAPDTSASALPTSDAHQLASQDASDASPSVVERAALAPDAEAPTALAPASGTGAPGADGTKPSSLDLSSLMSLFGGGGNGAAEKAPDPTVLPDSDVAKKGEALQTAWDEFRRGLLQDAQVIEYQHGDFLGKFDQKVTQIYYSYAWLGKGMDQKDKNWTDNTLDWRGDMTDVTDRINSFFCGVDPKQSGVAPKDFHGIPIPGHSYADIKAPRVAQEPGLCDADLKSSPSAEQVQKLRDEACKQDARLCTAEEPYKHRFGADKSARRAYLELQQRKQLVAKDYSKQVDDVFASVMEATDPIRKSIISRYEARLQKALLDALMGTSVKLKNGAPVDFNFDSYKESLDRKNTYDYPVGVIPAYLTENKYWKSMSALYPQQKAIFDALLARMDAKMKAADDLARYTLLAPNQRKLPASFTQEADQDSGMAVDPSAAPTHDQWKQVVQEWREFVIQ